MNKFHTLESLEILSLPPGRILDTFIEEYVVRNKPTKWSNGEQKELSCSWFEELARSCAEDDGGICVADYIPKYSRDLNDALKLTKVASLKDKPLLMNIVAGEHWVTFFDVPFKSTYYLNYWASGETLPLAICRAALKV